MNFHLSDTEKTVYIGIGSNLGNKVENCRKAINLIEKMPSLTLKEQSPLFRTEPVGVSGQDWYVNCVISLWSEIPAHQILKQLLSIETAMGRERRRKWDPRPIDLDILLFGNRIIHDQDLQVPHPLMHLRKFVLVPMVQLAPDMMHPIINKTMRELLKNLPEEEQSVVPIADPGLDCSRIHPSPCARQV